MADDAHMASRLGVELAEGGDGMLEGCAAEGAEALVDEEGVDGQAVADVAEGEGEGQGDEEALAAGDGADDAAGIALIGVLDHDDEGAGEDLEAYSRHPSIWRFPP